MKKATAKQLSFLDRYLTLWIFLAMVVGAAFTLLLREHVDYLTDRYSERKEQGIQESMRDIGKSINGVNLSQM